MDPNQIASELARIALMVEQLRKAVLADEPQFPKEKLVLVEKGVCLECHEVIENPEKSERGCHEHCYRKIRRSIAAGEITEAEAIEIGILMPKRPAGRRRASGTLLDQLRESRQAQGPLDESEILEEAVRRQRAADGKTEKPNIKKRKGRR